MTRWAERRAAQAALNGVETQFLVAVSTHLVRVPKRPRRTMLEELVETLSSRPASGSLEEISGALGDPAAVADELRSDAGFAGRVSILQRWRHMSRLAHLSQLALVVGAVVGLLAVRSYYAATPQILNACSGPVASDYERLAAAGETEYRMALRIGERYGIQLCPYSLDDGVTIERVHLANPEELAIQPVGWELSEPREITLRGDASDHRPFGGFDEGWRNVVVWFEAEYCNISGRIWFDELQLDYTYRGRSRTMDIPLLATYSVQSGPDQCSDEVSVADDSVSAAWRAAVDDEAVWRTGGSSRLGGRGPLDLWPESISRDLCRYLRGVIPATGFDGEPSYDQFEPLEARAVFQLDSPVLAETLIDGAVLGICPEFADQRDDLVALLNRSG